MTKYVQIRLQNALSRPIFLYDRDTRTQKPQVLILTEGVKMDFIKRVGKRTIRNKKKSRDTREQSRIL